MQHNPVHICEGALHFPAHPCHPTSLAHDIAAWYPWVWLAVQTRVHITTQPAPIDPPHTCTQHHMVPLQVWLAAHAWVHNTAQSAPIGPLPAHTQHHTAPLWVWLAARAPALHGVGITPVPELIVVLHYIYCTLNKQPRINDLVHSC
jgi:hypothetical protein